MESTLKFNICNRNSVFTYSFLYPWPNLDGFSLWSPDLTSLYIYTFVSIFSDTLKTRRALVTEQDQEFSEQVQTKEI